MSRFVVRVVASRVDGLVFADLFPSSLTSQERSADTARRVLVGRVVEKKDDAGPYPYVYGSYVFFECGGVDDGS